MSSVLVEFSGALSLREPLEMPATSGNAKFSKCECDSFIVCSIHLRLA